jgi:hypothetical protein
VIVRGLGVLSSSVSPPNFLEKPVTCWSPCKKSRFMVVKRAHYRHAKAVQIALAVLLVATAGVITWQVLRVRGRCIRANQ